ncbi:ABC transporter ATP-binding protein [Actinomadura sp. WMMB 499]|uniref:ABC transporter ATP-binding protein n=1 Tax=Actinomadura sp. WMMB 499 TaxID=1219491 RepID=UPI001249475C|nr:ABC transporter ATP-binding protein [Actinomadura sp. WMMB 499]QFG21343.1 ABC transporter ATP-binding protein [Actinomadura sp. WMMB 499]
MSPEPAEARAVHAPDDAADDAPVRAPRAGTLRAEGVGKVFAASGGPVTALAGVDLTVEPGEFLSVLGPSGCGKSTLMAIMAGLEAPSSGRVVLGDRPVTAPVLDAGVMFQRDLLLDWRDCESNILMQYAMRGLPAKAHRERARELLALVGMAQFAHRYPHELSGGMRQRVAICRALVHDPALLLMDEPFGALDALTRENLNVELSGLTVRAGTSVVFVTHSIDEAVFLGDRVVVMSRRPGRIVADVRVDLPRPRRNAAREDPRFVSYTGRLRKVLADHGDLGGAHDE